MPNKTFKLILALTLIILIVPHPKSSAATSFEDEDLDLNEISGIIYDAYEQDYYFLDQDNNKLGKVPLERSEEFSGAKIPMNTPLPKGALRIGTFDTWFPDELIDYVAIFEGPWHSFVGDATFYDTDNSKGEYGGYIEWTGPKYKGNLHDYIIEIRPKNTTKKETLAVAPTVEGTKQQFKLPDNTKIENLEEATIWGRNILGDYTPSGMVMAIPDKYEINNLSSDVDLGDTLRVSVHNSTYGIPEDIKNFVWVSGYSSEGVHNKSNSSLLTILDANQNVLEFVGEIGKINFQYKFPKNFNFPNNSKYIGVFWKSSTGEILGKAIQELPENLNIPVEQKSTPLNKNQVSVLPAGEGKYFINFSNLVTESELKVYDGDELLDTQIASKSSFTKLFSLNSSINKLSFSIVEPGKQESDKLIVSIQNNDWVYFDKEINVATDKVWKIKFNKSTNLNDLTTEYIYILDSTGAKFPINITPNEDGTIIDIHSDIPFQSGNQYYIYVEKNLTSKNGIPMKQGYIKAFTTK